ncbi:MAG: tyrosine-type recombinase/integrase [Solirubrobacterales bacterium]
MPRRERRRRHAGDKRPASRIGFEDYFREWIETYAGRTSHGFSETTRPEYRRPIETYALPRWGRVKLAEVEPADVRDLFGQMRRDGRSTSAIKKLRAALSAMFATAVEDGKLRSNPVAGVRIPAALDQSPVQEKAKALTRAELAILLDAIPADWRLFFEFLAHTGVRISEATGRWEHLDLGETPHVEIREQFYRGNRKALRSRDGRREIPLSPGMTARLLAHRRDTYKGAASPVFPSKAGTPLIAGKVRERVLKPAKEADGMERVGFHSFRHSCASMLFEQGRNPKQGQEWLGHADPAFTLRTYVHLMDGGVGDAAFPDEIVCPT